MKKKLLVTASTFPRFMGDTEPRFIYDLAKELNNYYDVTVLVPSAPGALNYEIMEGLKVIRYRYFPIKKLETLCYPGAIVPRIKEKKGRALLVPFLFSALWWNLVKISGQFDVIHCNWLIPQGIVQAFVKKTPYLLTGHGGDVTSLNTGIFKLLKKKALKNAGKVTVVSNQLKSKLLQTYSFSQEIPVISMGCNLKKFKKENRKENCFGQGSKKVVLFVGRLAEKKGVSYLIEAMRQIDALLIIVGEGPEKDKLKQQAAQIGGKVRFLGSKSHEELPQIYASSDLFCLPSVTAKDGDQEGLPTVALEAMASGLPVVGSDSGGIAEVVQDGITGYLVEPNNSRQIADKINRILKDEKLYEALSSHAVEKVKEYDYEVIAKKFAFELEEVRKRK